jgi:hypothetical protein
MVTDEIWTSDEVKHMKRQDSSVRAESHLRFQSLRPATRSST